MFTGWRVALYGVVGFSQFTQDIQDNRLPAHKYVMQSPQKGALRLSNAPGALNSPRIAGECPDIPAQQGKAFDMESAPGDPTALADTSYQYKLIVPGTGAGWAEAEAGAC